MINRKCEFARIVNGVSSHSWPEDTCCYAVLTFALVWTSVSVTPNFGSYFCEPSLLCSVYVHPASLFVCSSGGAKGKSMWLSWSGAKAVIKRYTPQSHTRQQEWKGFSCTTLIFFPFFPTFRNTSEWAWVCLPLLLHFYFLCYPHPSSSA